MKASPCSWMFFPLPWMPVFETSRRWRGTPKKRAISSTEKTRAGTTWALLALTSDWMTSTPGGAITGWKARRAPPLLASQDACRAASSSGFIDRLTLKMAPVWALLAKYARLNCSAAWAPAIAFAARPTTLSPSRPSIDARARTWKTSSGWRSTIPPSCWR